MKNLEGMRYDAFISYRHCEPDSFVARTLNNKLESIKLPTAALDKAKSGRTKIERVFRDEEELPLSEDLSEPINNALANSEFLICICTPRYLESRWCMSEIEVFLQTHDRDHILVVLAEGEPEESFPELLTQGGREPLAADTRGDTEKEILKKMNTAVLRISAAVFELNYDDLKQRHREAKLKHLMAFGGAVSAVVLAFAVFATVTLIKISRQNSEITEQNREISKQKDTISSQYTELQDKYAEQMADSSSLLMGKGRRSDAIRLLKSVLPDSDDRPYNANALRALYEATNSYGIDDMYAPVSTFDMDQEITSFNVSYDGKYVCCIVYNAIRVYDADTKEMVREFVPESVGTDSSLSAEFCGSDGIIIIDDKEKKYYSLKKSDEGISLPDEVDQVSSIHPSPSGRVTLLYTEKGKLIGIGNDGKEKYSIDVAGIIDNDGDDTEIGETIGFDKGRFVTFFSDKNHVYFIVADEDTGEVLHYHSEKTKEGYMSGTVEGNIKGDMVYYSVVHYENEDSESKTYAYAYDFKTGNNKWKSALDEYAVWGVNATKDDVYVNGEFAVYVLDKKTGKEIGKHYSDNLISETWVSNDMLYYLDQSAGISVCDKETFYDSSDLYYLKRPSEEVGAAKRIGEDIYYMPYGANYVVRYAQENAEGTENLGNSYDERIDYTSEAFELNNSGTITDETIGEVEGVDSGLLSSANHSADGKLIYALFRDHTIAIIDNDSNTLLRKLDTREKEFEGMRFSEITGAYILDSFMYSYILDKDYNIVCRTDRIVDEVDGSFIMKSISSDYYRVPYVSYDELMKRE